MHDFVTPPDLPEAGRPPTKNRQKKKRAWSTRILWRLSGILGAIAILIVVIVVAAPILGLTGNIAVGQAVTDHGLFMQVRSITFYKEEARQEDIMVSIKLQNMGDEDVEVVFGNEADGTNVLIVSTKFPGTNDPGFPLTPDRLPSTYQEQLLKDKTLHPGATMEGLVFYASVQNGQQAVSIDFWHSLSGSPFNFYHWAIPRKS
ncbi:MAG TPA: hypothetical protein VFN35_09170 [Ktedonobacteraceae bacterium]|nr:hypothetical protein [Ktedonobacteraceae bacterium]